MTFNGWIQIAIFAALVVAVLVPLGGYMARVFWRAYSTLAGLDAGR